jgi:hypothetical protein
LRVAELTQWLRSEARRQAARPDLLAALLAGGSFAYARYRLGFMALRMLLRTGIHAIEIQLLIAAFVPWEYFAPLLAYRAVCSLLGAAHWGALETLRERVRDAVRRRRPDEARGAVARALGLTLWAAAGLIVVVVGTEVASTLASGMIELRATYALACVLRLGADSALRALHSGVFAVRRVHRPLWSTLVPDLVELAVILFGFGELGLWSIPIAILAGGTCDAVLAFVFVRRAYLQRRFQLPAVWQSLSAARQVDAREAGSGAKHALASVTLQLDGVLLLILAQAGQSAPGAASFAALYYVLRPLMAASTHWVRTFYFDLKLVDSGAFRAFRPQLLRFLERLAVSWSFVLALVTLGLARFVFGGHASWVLLVLVPFFVARSAFALLQVVAFGAGDLKRLLQTGLAVIAGVFVLRAVGLSGMGLLAAVTVLLAITIGASRRWTGPQLNPTARIGLLDYCSWLASLRITGESKLAVLQVDARSARVGAVLRGLRVSYPNVSLTRWGRRYVLLAAVGDDMPSARVLVLACGGALQGVWVSEQAAPLTVFEQASRASALPTGWGELASRATAAKDFETLAREFKARFTGGEICDLQTGRGLSVRPVHAAILRSLVSTIQARSHGREARSERALPFSIAVFAPCGQARAIFIVDKNAPGFETFRSEAHDASVRASWPELFAQTVAGTEHASRASSLTLTSAG